MINQLLNRDFVLDQLLQVQEYLKLPADERRRGAAVPEEAKHVLEEDRQGALMDVERSLASERAQSSGQSHLFGRRGDEPPLDDWSFISRDPVISNLQTVLDYYFIDGPGKNKIRVKLAPETDRRGPGQVSLTGDVSLSGYEPSKAEGRRVFNKFSVTDPEWVSSGLAAGVRLFRGRHDFIKEASVVPIADQVRIVMVGDWGSGIPRAQKVAEHMRTFIDQGLAANREVHVVHLGDVYYSGWKREYEKRFLPFWPVKPGEAARIRSWCLNGNHDMYSGGFGYYDFLLKDPRFAAQAGASFFCLENKHWKIFGLDSSWDDGGLKDPQAAWVRSKIDLKKKTMLLTHHQPFSSYEKPATTMAEKLLAIRSAPGGVKSWFWGHEHRFMLFGSFDKVDFGRLIGHGGVPVYMTHDAGDAYPTPGTFEDRRFIKKLAGLEHWAYFGFAVLDFVDDKIQVQYIDEEGNGVHSQDTIV
jgi:hypothetical protein